MRRLLYRYDKVDGSLTIYTSGAPYFRLQLSSDDVKRLIAATSSEPPTQPKEG